MPANKADRVKDLLERYAFASIVLLTESARLHEIRECCTNEPCMLMNALTESVRSLRTLGEEVTRELREST